MNIQKKSHIKYYYVLAIVVALIAIYNAVQCNLTASIWGLFSAILILNSGLLSDEFNYWRRMYWSQYDQYIRLWNAYAQRYDEAKEYRKRIQELEHVINELSVTKSRT